MVKSESNTRLPTGQRRWRTQAAAILGELFASNPPETWDLLLDLRSAILRGDDWDHALDLFLRAKAKLEADNYLPFYRLRRLLAASLRLETSGLAGAGEESLSIAEILRQPHRSLEDARFALCRIGSARSPAGAGFLRRAVPILHVREVA